MGGSINQKDQPLYNSRIINTYIKLIKKNYQFVDIPEILNYANIKPYEVADQGHWFTQEQHDLFHERLVLLTGNESISREAGRFSASPEAIGAMRQFVLGLVGPAKVYELIGKATSTITRSSIYESKKIASNKIEVTVTPREGIKERQYQCENRIGFFEAISTVFGNELPKIEHPQCIFNGGNTCRYIISWENPFSKSYQLIVKYIFLIFILFGFLCGLILPFDTFLEFTPIFSAAMLILALLALIGDRLEKRDLQKSLTNLNLSTDELVEQIEVNYNNARLITEIGQAISNHTNIKDVLADVIQALEKRLDYDRGFIHLANIEKTELIFRAGYGIPENILELLEKTQFRLDNPNSKGIFVVSFKEQKSFLIDDINKIGKDLSPRSMEYAKQMGSKSFICCPIVTDGEPLGVFAVDNIKTKSPLVQSDLNLLMGIAPVIGISIRNAELLDAQAKQMKSILQVMAASIDARDPLTAGHSEKVTEYSLGICDELGISKDYKDVVGMAASLHDYGKIGIADSLLKKKGRLTDDEFEVIKTHSAKTEEILLQITFEGMMTQVPQIAAAHHEKLDGSGYPKGLKGNEIPLGAQIIAVADFFEAITAHRHYRDPMPIEKAFRLLNGEADIHFSKKIIEAFTRYYEKTYEAEKNVRMVSSK